MKLSFPILVLGVALAFVLSCKLPYNDIDENVNLTPEVAAPIVDKSITMNDMLKGVVGNGFIELLNDGSYLIKYSTNFTSPSTIELFASTAEPPRIPILLTTTTVPFPSPQGARIDEFEFKTGALNCFMRITTDDTLTVKVTIAEITKNNVSFEQNFKVTKDGFTEAFNLDGWTLKPKNGQFNIVYSATNRNNLPAFVNNQSFFQLTPFKYRVIKGYFGQQVVSLPEQSLNFDFFKNWKKQGEIKFANPRLRLTFENSMGLPIRLKSTVAEGVNSKGEVLALDSPLKDGEDIRYPDMTEIGKARQTTLVYDRNNSNLADLVNFYPEKFRLTANAFLNPEPTNTTAGFLTDKSQIISRFDFELPLQISAKGFVVEDTLDVDFSKLKNVIEGEFKLITINGLPVDLNMQGYFVDNSGQIVDSLITKNTLLLSSAILNANGTKASDQTGYHYIYVTSKQFNNIRNTKRMIARFTLATHKGGTTPVRIFSSDRVTLKLGFKAKVNL